MTEKRVETAADLAKSMTELYTAALSQPARGLVAVARPPARRCCAA